jgi:predicted ATPase
LKVERESAEEMLGALLGGGVELEALKKLILAKSEGAPFFMEEIIQGLFERGILRRNGKVTLTRPVSEIQIPTTVEGVLAARIDRLEPAEKELLQTAAVLGPEFSLAVLEKVVEEPRGAGSSAARSASASGVRLRGARLGRNPLPLQACAHPRRRLQLTAQREAGSCL